MRNLLIPVLILLLGALCAHPASAVSTRDVLAAEIISSLVEESPWDASGDVTVEVSELDISGYRNTAFEDLTVRLPRGMSRSGKVTFSVSLYRAGAEVERFWANARMDVYREAVVALVPLRRDRAITGKDVRIDRVEVSRAATAATNLSEVVGMVAKRPINPGMVVRRSFLKPKTVVKRGEPVVVRLENERIRIKYRATALENGVEGGVIGARTSSGKEIRGRVTGPGELLVRF